MGGAIASCQTTLANIDGFICDEMGGNQAPIARATATMTSGELPLEVEFTSIDSFDPDGEISRYEWNFGDGARASGEKVFHTYTEAGDYTARLTVTDTQGATAQESIAIVVLPKSIVDTDSPEIPVGFSGKLVEGNSVHLSWQTNKEEDLGGYFLYRNGAQIKTVPNTSTHFLDANLVAEGNYSYALSSFDTSGNESKRSSTVSITLEATDTEAPATPVGLSAEIVGSNAVRLAWEGE